MVVLDASAAVDLVLGRPAAEAVERWIRGEPLRMPAHFDAEALAGVRRYVIRREVSPERGSTAIIRIATLEAERVAIAPLLPAAFALRDRFGAYDALYAVLARRDGARLVTVDAPFARACEGFVDVELAQA